MSPIVQPTEQTKMHINGFSISSLRIICPGLTSDNLPPLGETTKGGVFFFVVVIFVLFLLLLFNIFSSKATHVEHVTSAQSH